MRIRTQERPRRQSGSCGGDGGQQRWGITSLHETLEPTLLLSTHTTTQSTTRTHFCSQLYQYSQPSRTSQQTPPIANTQQLFVCPSRTLRPSTRSRKPMKAPARSPQRSPRTTSTSVSNVCIRCFKIPCCCEHSQLCCYRHSPLKIFDLPHMAPPYRYQNTHRIYADIPQSAMDARR